MLVLFVGVIGFKDRFHFFGLKGHKKNRIKLTKSETCCSNSDLSVEKCTVVKTIWLQLQLWNLKTALTAITNDKTSLCTSTNIKKGNNKRKIRR